MEKKDLEKKLIKYSKYRVFDKKYIDFQNIKKFDLFYFVLYKNKVHKVIHHNINNKEALFELQSSKSLLHYLDTKLSFELTSYNKIDKVKLSIFVYCVPKTELNTYQFFINLYLSIDKQNFFLNSIEYIKRYYKFFTLVISIYIFLYTAYFYYALSLIGIKLELINDVNVIISFLIYYFIGIILTMTGLPLIKSDWIFIVDLIILFLLASMYFINKTELATKVNAVIIINGRRFFNGLVLIYTCMVLATILLVLLKPFGSIFYILSEDKEYKENPVVFYTMYEHFTGYPNILFLDSKKYIILGHNKINYLGYSTKSIIESMTNVDKQDLEDLCDLYLNKKETLLYKILTDSDLSGKFFTQPIVSVREKGLKFKELNLSNLGLDFIFNQKCTNE